ncbi:magnesium/cobalt transporter CorA [bacterium]|nr:magnesium/cobalt transporter CorA [candidate division CSSED10-310 bacterium]
MAKKNKTTKTRVGKPRRRPNNAQKKGMSPGTLLPGTPDMERGPVRITMIDYSETACSDEIDWDGSISTGPRPGYRWIIADGVHDPDVIRRIGSAANLHALVQEDIMNIGHPAKVEEWNDHVFLILKTIGWDSAGMEPRIGQISLLVGPDYVLTFHQNDREFLEPVKKRLLSGKGKIRTMGPGYLAYALVDSIVDHVFDVMDRINDGIESLEEAIFTRADDAIIQSIHTLKHHVLIIRKMMTPMRDILNHLLPGEVPPFPDTLRVYLQDVTDHVGSILETIDGFREMLSGLMDCAMTAISTRTNEVMKVLTIIATIFIPLTFITGVYGMNFQFMPELAWRWGYPVILFIMLATIGGMLLWFRRRKWLVRPMGKID